MSRTSRERTKLAAELVRKGAVLLAEPCSQCGGIQIRYHGKIYCTKHEDLAPVAKTEGVSFDNVVDRTREVLLSKLNQAARLLEDEKDPAKEDHLVSLMTKYFDLLQKLIEKRQSP